MTPAGSMALAVLGASRGRRFSARPASLWPSEGDGTRTRNHRIDSPNTPRYKSFPVHHFRQTNNPGCPVVARTTCR